MNDKQTLKLEAGKYYKTRDGEKAFVDAVVGKSPFSDATHTYPARGYVENYGAISWTLNGREFDETGGEAGRDIIAEWVEPKRIKGWVNMYPQNLMSRVWDTRENADKEAASDRIACMEIDIFEGHGLNGEAA